MLYMQGRPVVFMCLMIPVLEHAIRIVFARVNNRPDLIHASEERYIHCNNHCEFCPTVFDVTDTSAH